MIAMDTQSTKLHKYEYEVDLSESSADSYLLGFVGESKRVLELGCGPGSITRVLVKRNHCRVTGLELDESAIIRVAPHCEKVIQADLNSASWQDLLSESGKFDVVVAGDVLEHLYDPWSTLKKTVPLLGPNGYVVVSLPHIGHAAVMACLYDSDFEYRDLGLLDRTHIRFFGLKNIENLFSRAGFKITAARYHTLPPENTEFADRWNRLSPQIQDALRSSPYSDVYRVIVKAVPLAYPGAACALKPPTPQRTLKHRRLPLRKRIAAHLSPESKQQIRRLLARLGISV